MALGQGEGPRRRRLVRQGARVEETERTVSQYTGLPRSAAQVLAVGRDPNVMTVPEAANRLKISKDKAYDLARRGELPGAFQLGRSWRVSVPRFNAVVHGS